MRNNHFSFAAKCLLILGLLAGFAETAAAQSTYFQGVMRYNIRVYGKYADAFLADEPPTKMDLYLRGGDFIINEYGGQKTKMFLFIADSNHTYIVDAANKRYFKKDYYQDTTNVIPEATATGKTAVVAGLTCDEYKVVYPERTIYYYVNDKYRADISKFEGKDEAKANFLTRGLEGRIPLRTRNETPNLTVEVEVAKIEPKTLELQYFRIPEEFKVKGRDPR